MAYAEHRVAHAEAQVRVDEYRAQREGLKELFDPVITEPVPGHLIVTRWRWGRTVGAVAAGLLLLATGTVAGWYLWGAGATHLSEPDYVVREAAIVLPFMLVNH